jgi:hypothetical protein
MKFWLFLLVPAALLSGEMDWQADIQKPFVITIQIPPLSTAPVIPLQPQFPLGLTEANREMLIDNPARIEEEKRRIQVTLDNHTFPWLTMLALLGCGGIGWTAYLTRESWYKRPTKPISTISPQQKVNQSLQNLQKRHLLEQGLIQTYYAELSSILLDALHSRSNRITSKLTTIELAQRLKDEHNLSANQKRDILSFLAEIDQVKFAGETPSLEQAKQMHHKIESFIQQLYS